MAQRVERRRRLRARAVVAGLFGAVAVAVVACTTAPPLVRFPPADGPGPVSAPAPDTAGPLVPRGRDLVDAHGRVVQLRGQNAVNKGAPFYVPLTDGWLGDAEIDALLRDGHNAVRLGVWPAALMPEPGVVDEAYLDAVEAGIDRLARAGVWVLLDLHQDVFEGMPAWATTPETAALPRLGDDVAQGQLWALQYLSPRSLQQWEDWWDQVPVAGGRSAADLLGDGVAALARRVDGRANVVGIDLLNEPFAGSPIVQCVMGACPDRYAQVRAVHEAWTAKVRAAAPTLSVWWEPFTFGPPFPGQPAPDDERVGYTFHSYCPLVTDGGEPVQPDPGSNWLCQLFFDTNVAEAVALSERWDVPVIMGEFGASSSPVNSTRLVELADRHRLSWIHWHWPGRGAYPEVVRTNLVRVYPQATAGRVTEQRFDAATGAFDLRYVPDHDVDAPTSIAVPPEAYPDGYRVEVTGGEVTSAPHAGRLTVEASTGAAEVVVALRRAPA